MTLYIHRPGLIPNLFSGSFVLLFCIYLNVPARAQIAMEAGLYLGDSYYIGDLNPNVHFKNAQIAYGAFARYNIDDRWAVKLGWTEGKVTGNSEGTNFLPGRNLQFESPITDVSMTAEFNFFEYFTGSRYNWITPYIYAGIGYFHFNPMSGGHRLQPLGTEGQNVGYEGRKPYSLNQVSLPFGLGVKVSLGKRIGITAFWEMHKTFTGYIDDVSKTYYLNGPAINQNDLSEILSDPTKSHTQGMQRGNNNYDWYSFSGVTVSYKFTLRGSRRCKENKRF
jgi:hypothetical protein